MLILYLYYLSQALTGNGNDDVGSSLMLVVMNQMLILMIFLQL